MRTTASERLSIENRARERKLAVSDYLLRCALGKPAQLHADVDAINYLREICIEVKNLYHANTGVSEAALDKVMKAAIAAIARVWENPRQMR
ncbi:hypothetical protein DIE23_28480 [Burkholderia sp. Bp9143]|nr:hypothetical protein DIE23_28480 [Burkholderia sp. Bp9143]